MLAPGPPATNQLGCLEHAHVLGGRGKGHRQGGSKLAEAALSDRQLADDRAASGVRQGVEEAVKPEG